MSLPTYATFFKGNTPLASGFCNIGWFVQYDRLLECIKNALDFAKKRKDDYTMQYNGETYYPVKKWKKEWDNVIVYDMRISRKTLHNHWESGESLTRDDVEPLHTPEEYQQMWKDGYQRVHGKEASSS